MSFCDPRKLLFVYGSLAGLVYIETDEFRQDAPLLVVLPTVTLAALTLLLSMEKKPKLCTAASFLVFAEAHYLQLVSRRGVEWLSILVTISHLLYLASFASCIRKIWYWACIPVGIYYTALMYYCFGDVYWSLPVLTTLIALQIAAICCSVIAGASVWYSGSRKTTGSQADLFRLIGLVGCLTCSSLFIIDLFGIRIDKATFTINTLSYFFQGLLFLANERAF